ncbi:hypothetical protein K0M31_009343 [Melipona bicolor]|uniref:TIL domain-containing protein n=1 Tax=Melipona bicolor TaxID=60889 RepID=A0AA40FPD4_9HYME|nr:hypothetical protein K0M31_009343 [Melipona bicolor]
MFRFVCVLFVALVVLSTTSFAKRLICDMPNEEYRCGSACQRQCATLNQPCTIVNVRCNDGCYCKEGYARNDNGVCIPITKCNSKRPKLNRVPLYRLSNLGF